MSDFTSDFFLDPGIIIKQEPNTMDTSNINVSASVPIPSRRNDLEYRDMTLDFETSQSPSYNETGLFGHMHPTTDIDRSMMWSTRITDMDIIKADPLMHMDEDDIFQVDKADLIQGPTLAELNANDETLLGDLNFDDLLLPEENNFRCINGITISPSSVPKYSAPTVSYTSNINNNSQTLLASSYPTIGTYFRDSGESHSNSPNPFSNQFGSKTTMATFSPTTQVQSNSNSPSLLQSSSPLSTGLSSLQQKHSTLHELLMKKDDYISPDRSLSILGKSVPGPSSPNIAQSMRMSRPHMSRLSSSAPTHLGIDQIWQRREPRQHLLSTGSLVEAGSTSSISTGGVLSPEAPDFSHDEFESDEDSDHYEDFSSDNGDSDDDDDPHSKSHASRKERFFWQYNVQAKGPKGQRLVMKSKMEDPHVLNEIQDPVFSPDCSVRGIKHSGKARKGDGNDLTPNPRKLHTIGKELDKLGRIINDMTPVSELPFNVRPKTRKEKNKLASRACRLKKKAQHEANKIKLHGLENEHKRLINAISQFKQLFVIKYGDRITESPEDQLSGGHIDKLVKSATKVRIAGHTTEYVNKILEKLKGGSIPGSLEDL